MKALAIVALLAAAAPAAPPESFEVVPIDEVDGRREGGEPIALAFGADKEGSCSLTSGRFGIWGHDLSDLFLEELRFRKNEKGVTIWAGLGS